MERKKEVKGDWKRRRKEKKEKREEKGKKRKREGRERESNFLKMTGISVENLDLVLEEKHG